jgi:hypothetical protein
MFSRSPLAAALDRSVVDLVVVEDSNVHLLRERLAAVPCLHAAHYTSRLPKTPLDR